ncbi:MAG: hypothetical protein HY738_00590 [Bacteroidia bacterium]|nr:hypothetical protein [Bacteroidia bacterium]
MQPDNIDITVFGRWNKRIFTPAWVSENLFHLKKGTQINGIVNPSEFELGYKHDGILLLPTANSLEIKIEDTKNIDSIRKAPKILYEILSLLPHTPIKAIILNIKFKNQKITKSKLFKDIKECEFSNIIKGYNMCQIVLKNETPEKLVHVFIDYNSNSIMFSNAIKDKKRLDENDLIINYINEIKKEII